MDRLRRRRAELEAQQAAAQKSAGGSMVEASLSGNLMGTSSVILSYIADRYFAKAIASFPYVDDLGRKLDLETDPFAYEQPGRYKIEGETYKLRVAGLRTNTEKRFSSLGDTVALMPGEVGLTKAREGSVRIKAEGVPHDFAGIKGTAAMIRHLQAAAVEIEVICKE